MLIVACVDLRQLLEDLALVHPNPSLDLCQEPIVLGQKQNCVGAQLGIHLELSFFHGVNEALSCGQVR